MPDTFLYFCTTHCRGITRRKLRASKRGSVVNLCRDCDVVIVSGHKTASKLTPVSRCGLRRVPCAGGTTTLTHVLQPVA